jgi:hypothetical protein
MHRDGAWGAGSRAKAEMGGFLFAGKTNEGESRSVQHQRRSKQRPFNDARSKIPSLALCCISSSGLWLAARALLDK